MSSAAVALKPKKTSALEPHFEPRRGNGFVGIMNPGFNHAPRLLAGDEWPCVLLICSETFSAPRDEGTPPPPHTRPMHHNEFASYIYKAACEHDGAEFKWDPNATLRVLLYLLERKVISRRPATKKEFPLNEAPGNLRGWYVYWIELRTWKDLPNRVAPQRKPNTSPEALDADEEVNDRASEAADLAKLRRERLHVAPDLRPDEPLQLRARQSSPAYEPRVPVERVQFKPRHDGILVFPTTYLGRLQVEFALSPEVAEIVLAWQRSKHNSTGAKHSGKNVSADSTVLKKTSPPKLGMFQTLAIEAGVRVSDEVWADAEAEWRKLSIEERLGAVAGMRAQRQWVLEGIQEPKYIGHPDTYLEKKRWLSQQEPKRSKLAKLNEEERRMDQFAEQLDRRRGR
jgi:hypothetical protein